MSALLAATTTTLPDLSHLRLPTLKVHDTGVNFTQVTAIVAPTLAFIAVVGGYITKRINAWVALQTRRLDLQDVTITKIVTDAEQAKTAAVITSKSVARIEGFLAGATTDKLPAVPYPDIKEEAKNGS